MSVKAKKVIYGGIMDFKGKKWALNASKRRLEVLQMKCLQTCNLGLGDRVRNVKKRRRCESKVSTLEKMNQMI